MNTPRSNSLATRPTYQRQPSSENRIEMATSPARSNSPLSRSPSVLPQDVYDAAPSAAGADTGSSFRERFAQTAGLGRAQIVTPVRTAGGYAAAALRAHWRELAVGGALTGIASWAIWATVKIHKIDSVPFCIADAARDL